MQMQIYDDQRLPEGTGLASSVPQDVYAAIHKGGLWLGPRFQAGLDSYVPWSACMVAP